MSESSTATNNNNNNNNNNTDRNGGRGRILSIQSHVVSGYVGNKAAVFPLQLLGFDVDVVNSVHFSNHTGYPGGIEGDVLQGDQLVSILEGLERNGLLSDITHVLTGYIGSESFLNAVLEVLRTIGRIRPDVRYVCDPVLGDGGKFYVPIGLVDVYQNHVIPKATVVTPNQFEVEQLTGIRIVSMNDALRACRKLHDMGPTMVVITSLENLKEEEEEVESGEGTSSGAGGKAGSVRPNDNDGNRRDSIITILASKRHGSSSNDDDDDDDNHHRTDDDDDGNGRDNIICHAEEGPQQQQQQQNDEEVWRIDSPLIEGYYTGTGDLTTALMLAHTALDPNDLAGAMEKVINTMHSVIQRTALSAGVASLSSSASSSSVAVSSRELKLIQCKDLIENPPSIFKAKRIR